MYVGGYHGKLRILRESSTLKRAAAVVVRMVDDAYTIHTDGEPTQYSSSSNVKWK